MASTSSCTEDQTDSSTSSEDRIEELEQRTRELQDEIKELRRRLEECEESPEGRWTPQQVADYLNVHIRTVEREIDDGKLIPLWVRGQRRFEPETIRAYLREHCTSKGTG